MNIVQYSLCTRGGGIIKLGREQVGLVLLGKNDYFQIYRMCNETILSVGSMWKCSTVHYYLFHSLSTMTELFFENLSLMFKGSDRLCKVVELSMQCCGKLLSDSFETY